MVMAASAAPERFSSHNPIGCKFSPIGEAALAADLSMAADLIRNCKLLIPSDSSEEMILFFGA